MALERDYGIESDGNGYNNLAQVEALAHTLAVMHYKLRVTAKVPPPISRPTPPPSPRSPALDPTPLVTNHL